MLQFVPRDVITQYNLLQRDSAGNIILDVADDNPQKLLIDPAVINTDKSSVIRALPTAFSYFSFPVSENIPPEQVNIDVDFADLLPELPDPIFARYRPASNYRIPRANPSVLGNFDVNTPPQGQAPRGLEFSVVESGTQLRKNLYTVSKQVSELNRPLRFILNLAVINNSNSPSNIWISFFKKDDTTNGTIRNFKPGGNLFYPLNASRAISPNDTSTFNIETIIQPDEYIRNTVFQVGAITDGNVTIDSILTYWAISDATQQVNEFGESI